MAKKTSAAKPKKSVSSDATAQTAREEMALILMRELSMHQQREVIQKIRALVDANRVIRTQLKSPLSATSNETVRAAFKDIPVPQQKKNARAPKKAQGRPPGTELDDYEPPKQ